MVSRSPAPINPHPSPLPAIIQPLLDDYLGLLQHRLPALLAGCYLHGSLALGAFNPRLSDIDLVVVTSRPCTADDSAHLRAIHQTLAERYPRWPLEASYLEWPEVGRCDGRQLLRPHYHD